MRKIQVIIISSSTAVVVVVAGVVAVVVAGVVAVVVAGVIAVVVAGVIAVVAGVVAATLLVLPLLLMLSLLLLFCNSHGFLSFQVSSPPAEPITLEWMKTRLSRVNEDLATNRTQKTQVEKYIANSKVRYLCCSVWDCREDLTIELYGLR